MNDVDITVMPWRIYRPDGQEKTCPLCGYTFRIISIPSQTYGRRLRKTVRMHIARAHRETGARRTQEIVNEVTGDNDSIIMFDAAHPPEW